MSNNTNDIVAVLIADLRRFSQLATTLIDFVVNISPSISTAVLVYRVDQRIGVLQHILPRIEDRKSQLPVAVGLIVTNDFNTTLDFLRRSIITAMSEQQLYRSERTYWIEEVNRISLLAYRTAVSLQKSFDAAEKHAIEFAKRRPTGKSVSGSEMVQLAVAGKLWHCPKCQKYTRGSVDNNGTVMTCWSCGSSVKKVVSTLQSQLRLLQGETALFPVGNKDEELSDEEQAEIERVHQNTMQHLWYQSGANIMDEALRFGGELLGEEKSIGVVSYPIVLGNFSTQRGFDLALNRRGIQFDKVWGSYIQIHNCRLLGVRRGVLPGNSEYAHRAVREFLDILEKDADGENLVHGFDLSDAPSRSNGLHTYFVLLPSDCLGLLRIEQWDFGQSPVATQTST